MHKNSQNKYYPAIDSPNVLARFYDFPMLMVKKSKDSCEQIYENRTHIEIKIRSKSDVMDRPATEKDFERFPESYSAYMGKIVRENDSGTPIENLKDEDGGLIPGGLALQYRGKGVETIEDLANLYDGLIQSLGNGSLEWRKAARKQVKWAESPEIKQVVEENKTLQEQVESLQKKMEVLTAAMMEKNHVEDADPVDDLPLKKQRKHKK